LKGMLREGGFECNRDLTSIAILARFLPTFVLKLTSAENAAAKTHIPSGFVVVRLHVPFNPS
jgi:hypothetical protein